MADRDFVDILNTIIAEANAEGPEGMRRVAETILNRAAIRGISPAEVVRQPHQYTGFGNPGPAAVAAMRDPASITAAEAAWELARQPGDPTGGADHYFNPNVVNPGWQNSMNHTGDFGGHSFYSSRPVPAEALAALLAPTAPTPAAMPQAVQNARARNTALDQLRTSPMAAPSIADLYGGIYATPDLTQPGAVDRSVTGIQQDPSTAAALAAMLAPKRAPTPMPTGVTQSYAGQETTRSAAQRAADSLFNGDPGIPASGPVVASLPTTGIGQPPTTRTVRSVPMPAAPAVSASDLARAAGARSAAASLFNGDPGTPAPGPVVASIPSAARTNVSASDLVRAAGGSRVAAATPARTPAPMAMGVTQSYAGQEAIRPQTVRAIEDMFAPATAPSVVRTANPQAGRVALPADVRPNVPSTATAPQQKVSASDRVRGNTPPAPTSATAAIAEAFGPAQPAGTINPNKSQDRLAPGQWATAPGGLGQDPTLFGFAPTPRSLDDAAKARKTNIIEAPPAAPSYKTITEQVENPEWARAQEMLRGQTINKYSRDGLARYQAGIEAAKKIPQFISVTKKVAVPGVTAPVPRAARPAAQPPTSAAFWGGSGSSGGSSAATFQGTSTGKTYVEGQQYRTGDGRIMRANADGSFTNVSTGSTSRGSSGGVTSPGGQSYDRTTGTWV